MDVRYMLKNKIILTNDIKADRNISSKKYIRNSKKRSAIKLNWNTRCILCLLPSLAGMSLFFFWPYLRVLYYSLIDDQFHKNLVGLANYVRILGNSYFQLAMKNSLLLILIAVPALIILAITLSLLLSFQLSKMPKIRDSFIFPMLIPTASIVIVWQQLFSSSETVLPIYLLFIWKNIGICIILLTAALTTIDREMLEDAKLDGARSWQLHIKITIPVITPTIFFTILLAIVNSFKIFKESYLYYGNKYPPDHSYTLQYFMNNNFLKFDYQVLAASSIITSLLVLAIVGIGLSVQRRFQS